MPSPHTRAHTLLGPSSQTKLILKIKKPGVVNDGGDSDGDGVFDCSCFADCSFGCGNCSGGVGCIGGVVVVAAMVVLIVAGMRVVVEVGIVTGVVKVQ